jgi:hypothetical protein
VRGEVLTDSDKRLPLVAHQVGSGLDLFIEHAFAIERLATTERQPGSGACPDIRRSNRPCATRISTASVFPASMFLLKLNPIELPWYGPVCPVVWEGRRREASPYPDQPIFADSSHFELPPRDTSIS